MIDETSRCVASDTRICDPAVHDSMGEARSPLDEKRYARIARIAEISRDAAVVEAID